MSKLTTTKKIALITGSSSGIGRAIATTLARHNYTVLLTYHQHQKEGESTLKSLKAITSDIYLYHLDITSFFSIEQVVRTIVSFHGRIDVLVNNAGIWKEKELSTITIKDFDKTIHTNLRGPFFLIKEIFPIMKKQRYGRIINIASVGGQYGGPNAPHYAASKAGLISLTKSIARLGAPYNITSNAISPGHIITLMTEKVFLSPPGKDVLKSIPLKRFGTPEDISGTCRFLLSKEGDYITGQTINVNGGVYFG